MGCKGWIDCSPKAPLERTLYTVLIMWLAWQQAGGGWEPTIFSTDGEEKKRERKEREEEEEKGRREGKERKVEAVRRETKRKELKIERKIGCTNSQALSKKVIELGVALLDYFELFAVVGAETELESDPVALTLLGLKLDPIVFTLDLGRAGAGSCGFGTILTT